jgi:hypothetical protein
VVSYILEAMWSIESRTPSRSSSSWMNASPSSLRFSINMADWPRYVPDSTVQSPPIGGRTVSRYSSFIPSITYRDKVSERDIRMEGAHGSE